MSVNDRRETLRFGDFELDVAAYELRRKGRPVRVERQPMDLLLLLVERRGVLVSRQEIIDRLWGKDVFVDVETGVHTAIRKIRQALHDSREDPVFIETVSGKGYRFIAAVEILPAASERSPIPMDPGPGPLSVPDHTVVVQEPRLADRTAATATSADSAKQRQPRTAVRALHRAVAALGMLAAVLGVGWLAWSGLNTGASPSRLTLAVLPFENLGPDAERQYLADGLTEETAALLSQIDPDRLSVKGRTGRYKGTTKTADELGRELSVDYLVEGSIRLEGPRLHVTAKLIRVRDHEHVWSQTFDHEPTSILGLQRELSTAIARQIRLRLSADRVSALDRRHSANADAYDIYLRARYLENRRNPEANARAIEHYQRAVALDRNYALAWSGLTMTYGGSVLNGDARPREAWSSAREAAAQAIRADPKLPEAQLVTGYLNWLADWDWTAAEAAFRRVIELDPSNARAHMFLGHVLSQAGRHSEAEPSMRAARELDPLAVIGHALSSQVAFQARDYRSAVERARQVIQLDSAFWIGHMMLGQAYERIGEDDLALEALADATRFSGGNSKPVALRGYVLAKSGRTNEAREVLRMLDIVSRKRYVPPFAMALVHLGLGERDAVFEWLDRAFAERDAHLIFLTVDPKWDAVRSDPRFEALIARCGFTTARSR